ncbi:MAG: caspase family protein, partial [Cyanobacteria bacterium]|nr:caspase family protein [Cyanobacteriota bacterium]
KETKSLAIGSDDLSLISGSADGTIKTYALPGGNLKSTISEKCGTPPVLGRAGKLLVTSNDDEIQVWNAISGNRTYLFSKSSSPRFTFVSFDHDGGKIVSRNGDGTVELWDVRTGKAPRVLAKKAEKLAVTSDFTQVAIANGTDVNLINLSNINTPIRVTRSEESKSYPHTLAYSADNKILAVAYDKKVILWNATTGKARPPMVQESAVTSLCFGRQDNLLAIGHEDGTTCLLKPLKGKLVKVFGETSKTAAKARVSQDITAVALSHNGRLLATAGGRGKITLWDVTSGDKIRSFHLYWDESGGVRTLKELTDFGLQRGGYSGFEIQHLSFSSDDRLLLTVEDDQTRLWKTETGEEFRRLSGNWGDFGPDGRLLVTALKSLHFERISDGGTVATLTGSVDSGWAVVTPDGRFDASGLDDIRSVAWVMPDDPLTGLPIDIFMQEYYEPNLLARSIRGDTFVELPTLTNLNRVQPDVTITGASPHPGSEDLVDVHVAYKSVSNARSGSRSGVYDLRLFRDGQLAAYMPEQDNFSDETRSDLSHGSSEKLTHTFTVKIPHDGAEKVSFSAYAFNNNKVKSETSTFDYRVPNPLPRKQGRAVVIAFGVNVYSDPKWNLEYAASDAREYRRILEQRIKDSGRFSDVTFVGLVSDKENAADELPATKECLRDILLSLSGHQPANKEAAEFLETHNLKLGPDDFVLIAFSCHGDLDGQTGEYYLFPSDIGANQSQGLTPDLEKAGISSAELTDWLKDVQAAEITMIIDACHSGAASGKSFKPGPMDSPGLGQLAYYKRMSLLSATEAESSAQ